MFKGNGTRAAPVPANQVRVAQSRDAVSEEFTELGVTRAKAPSAQEAVDLAKQKCGQAGGGNLLILNTPPFESNGSWRVDASCVRTKNAPAAAPSGSGGRAPQ
ncbi:MAG: hypothetical protein KC468_16705 [Myxococcales bacterium]|nr:hypothetical protein [Myxococcales bacterium]